MCLWLHYDPRRTATEKHNDLPSCVSWLPMLTFVSLAWVTFLISFSWPHPNKHGSWDDGAPVRWAQNHVLAVSKFFSFSCSETWCHWFCCFITRIIASCQRWKLKAVINTPRGCFSADFTCSRSMAPLWSSQALSEAVFASTSTFQTVATLALSSRGGLPNLCKIFSSFSRRFSSSYAWLIKN